MRLIDTHCHLNFKVFDSDFLEVAKRSHENGVEKIIIVGSDPETSKRALKVAREINSCCHLECSEAKSRDLSSFAYVAVGIHAIHTDRADFDKIVLLASDPLVVGIGESGLDFYHDKERETEKEQIDLFKQHIELALKLDKPLIIHNRLADERIREIVDSYPELKKAVLHCFSTDHNMASWAVEKGFYLSFTGNITYGNKKIKKAIERTPIERIMVETDAPYNVPEPFRSEGVNRCEPYHAGEVVKKIALIKNLDSAEVAEQVFKNSLEFFDL